MIYNFLKKSNYGKQLTELEEKVQEIYSEGINIGETYEEKVSSFIYYTWTPFVIFSTIYQSKNPIAYLKEIQEQVEKSKEKVSLKEAFEILGLLQDVFIDALLNHIDYEE